MISLHDYSKCNENVNESLPTLLNNLNELVDEDIEIVSIKPQEITIFQVFKNFIYILGCICMRNIYIFFKNFNTGNKQKIQKVYWLNKYYLQTTV